MLAVKEACDVDVSIEAQREALYEALTLAWMCDPTHVGNGRQLINSKSPCPELQECLKKSDRQCVDVLGDFWTKYYQRALLLKNRTLRGAW